MEDYEIVLENDGDKRKLILYIDDAGLNDLLGGLNFIDLNGGQFTWGYNRKSNAGTITISFKKVKLTSEGKLVEDSSESFSCQPIFRVMVRNVLTCLGLYYLLHYIVGL
jgi:hypothetical protein